MKLFFYYVWHTLKNSIRKLFRTWVAVFVVGCIALGVVVGIGASLISDIGNAETPDDDPVIEEPAEQPSPEEILPIAELFVSGVVILLFLSCLLTGGKGANDIFSMADVNFLFPSPISPQSVLLFRLSIQVGAWVAACIYVFIEIPILTGSFPVAAAMILAFLFLILYRQLFAVFLFSFVSQFAVPKRWMKYATLLLLLAVAVPFMLYYLRSDTTPYLAAVAYFNAPATRFIPVYGWLKGLPLYAIEGNYPLAALMLFLLTATAAALFFVNSRLKPDFYEEALQRSGAIAEAQAAMTGDTAQIVTRDKPRSDKISRTGIGRGSGASVFFYKTIRNRVRFAPLGFLTKTTVTYFIVAGATAFFTRRIAEDTSSTPLLPVIVLGALLFFRALGNPIAEDTGRVYFRLIPESSVKKIFYAELGGTVSCALDLLPAFIAFFVLLGVRATSVPFLFLSFLFLITLDFYSSNFGLFLDLSLSESLPKEMKSAIQILLIYVSVIPNIAVIAVIGFALQAVLPCLFAAAVMNLLLGGAGFFLSALFLSRGQR